MREPLMLEKVRYCLSMGGKGILENVDVRIEDGRIASVGGGKQRGDEVMDCSGCILIPGLVNAHTHSSMIALRGLNDDAPLNDWLESMWEIEPKLTGEAARLASELAFLEMARYGTTACMDQYEAFEAARAAEKAGIRMANGPALISKFAPPEERLDQTREFHDLYRGNENILPVVNLHSIYTNDDETMAKAADLSKELGIPLHVHCSETREEVFSSRKVTGKLAVERLDANGALHEHTVLAHLGWAASWEFNRIAEARSSVVHCPSSNLKLGTGGFFPFRDLKAKGIRIGLGTDSAASNNSLDMFREMKEMALVQKGQYWDPAACRAMDALHAATLGGNSILRLNGGAIEEGRIADLALLDIDPGILPLRRENLASALVYAATGSMVRGTMVHGEWIYLDGKDGNGNDISERAREISGELERSFFRE
ncbi:MAG: amidohydrolase [Candidatus Thermoplasmatota archaeon]|nr:amidohydrolase [Candidatus Thermoplasmatota archaeon]